MINDEYYDDTGKIEINTIGDFRSAIAYRVYNVDESTNDHTYNSNENIMILKLMSKYDNTMKHD